jgi:signal transduction histidine kinase
MLADDLAMQRVMAWRSKNLGSRLGHAILLAALTWLATKSDLAPVWLVAITALSVLESSLFHSAGRTGSGRTRTLALVALAASTVCFAAIALVLMAHPSSVALPGAGLILCAINLNNTVMMRGWRLASRIATAPSTLLLLGMPLAAWLMGYPIGLTEACVLEVGAVAYIAFIAVLVATLNREGEALQRALADLEGQRDVARAAVGEAERARTRWSMLFDQSPLPQVCFDASRMYEVMREHWRAGNPRLGDVLGGMASSVGEAFRSFRLTEANAAARALFGVDASKDGLVGHFDASLLKGMRASLNQLGPRGDFPPFEAKVHRSDGVVFDVVVHIRNIHDGGKPWSACIATYVDVTEAKRAARAQQEATEAAERANQAKSDFLANMSHEIRTPLNGVMGMVQAMARDDLPSTQRERLEIIRHSGLSLQTILNDILDLSKIEAGKLELEEAAFDLGEIVEGACSIFGEEAARKGLELAVAIEPAALGRYLGDSVRVRQVLSNLISNALKFTSRGSVRVGVDVAGGAVCLSVADTGIGIPADRIDRLFNKFVQADSSTTRLFGGTGLGLAISHELCKAMGGAIAVQSEAGRGSTFTVELPLARIGEAEEAPAEAGACALAAATDGPLRILAAEDNPVNQLVLKTLLGQAGIDPFVVENGAEAVAAWERQEWDLILMDAQMPVMDGPEASRMIRAREADSGRRWTPIIALTANAMSHQTEAYHAAGMNGVVSKPINVGQLFAAIAQAVSPERSESAA